MSVPLTLTSSEGCTVAHDNIDTCGYCQRDALLIPLRRANAAVDRVMAECIEFAPNLAANLINALQASESLEKLTAQQLVDLAMERMPTGLTGVQDGILQELYNRVRA